MITGRKVVERWIQFKRLVREFLLQVPYLGDALIALYRLIVPSPPCPIQGSIEAHLADRSAVSFLQIGSNDGVQSDPLRDLILKNRFWRGVFVEPVPFLWEHLRTNYRDKKRFAFENVAVGEKDEFRTFYYLGEEVYQAIPGLSQWTRGIGSFNREHLLEHLEPSAWPFIRAEELECVTLRTLLDRNGLTLLDVLHIDTEGYDYKVLSQYDFGTHRPAVVLYEHVHLDDKERELAQALLREHGYQLEEFRSDTLALHKG